MALDPRPRPTVLRVAISAALLAVMVYLAAPESLGRRCGARPAAGRAAAGLTASCGSSTALADFMIPVGAAFSVLG